VALVRRPAKGLLGGMLGLPTGSWQAGPVREAPPARAAWKPAGEITHVFTHFSLRLEVFAARVEKGADGFVWAPVSTARAELPTVFRKALDLALEAAA
jgi:A/G-specific adenine glycosylase